MDHEVEVLESSVTKTRNKRAALKFLIKAMHKHGRPEVIVTDKLRSYGAALREIGAAHRQEAGRWLNNLAENSPSGIPKAGARDAPFPAHAKFAEIVRRTRLYTNPFQFGAQPLLFTKFQIEPCCRYC